jgi:hypothetical protein
MIILCCALEREICGTSSLDDSRGIQIAGERGATHCCPTLSHSVVWTSAHELRVCYPFTERGIYRLMSVGPAHEWLVSRRRRWPARRRMIEDHIHVPDAESSGSVVNRDLHGPTRVAQTNHKEIACFCLPSLRHGVGDFCVSSLALAHRSNYSTPSISHFCDTHSCVELLYLLQRLALSFVCYLLRRYASSRDWSEEDQA